ncbi:MAG: hypothetical protein Q4Q58_05495 [Thermoplasmata archaeon]|nr:hypothetical protein [Thermoplasmata archaeon]
MDFHASSAPSNAGSESLNATNLEFSLIWVFHLNATDLMLASEHTTGTFPSMASARTLASHPSGRTFASLYALRLGRKERISSERSGPPAARMMARVYPIM